MKLVKIGLIVAAVGGAYWAGVAHATSLRREMEAGRYRETGLKEKVRGMPARVWRIPTQEGVRW